MAGLIFGLTTTLNAAAYCAPLTGISTGQHQSEQVTDSTADLYGSEGALMLSQLAGAKPAGVESRQHPADRAGWLPLLGYTLEECEAATRKAIEFHIEGLRLAGESVLAATSHVAVVTVAA